jgi:stage II sporulation protein M
MGREEDYDLQERRVGVEAETPQWGVEDRVDAAREERFSIENRDTKVLSYDSMKPKKAGFSEYVHFIWPYVLIITFVFFGSFVTGYFSASSFPGMADTLMESFSSRFGPLLEMSPFYIMFAIFLNNSFVSLISLVLGLALGILPIIFIAFNGYLVGVISNLVAQQRGVLFISLALAPHGIIELPMVFLSAGIGLRLGHQVFSALLGKPTEIKRDFKEGLIFYFRWIVPFLFVAAIIETFITPLILSFI